MPITRIAIIKMATGTVEQGQKRKRSKSIFTVRQNEWPSLAETKIQTNRKTSLHTCGTRNRLINQRLQQTDEHIPSGVKRNWEHRCGEAFQLKWNDIEL